MSDWRAADSYSRRVAELHRLRCAGCRSISVGTARGWRCYRTGEIDLEDTPELEGTRELVVLCPACGVRELDDD